MALYHCKNLHISAESSTSMLNIHITVLHKSLYQYRNLCSPANNPDHYKSLHFSLRIWVNVEVCASTEFSVSTYLCGISMHVTAKVSACSNVVHGCAQKISDPPRIQGNNTHVHASDTIGINILSFV